METVSIVLPVYNHRDYVAEAIDSILAQDYARYELIVIDDGSTDGVADVLDRYHDPRILRMRQENRGTAHALNRGFSLAKGAYLTWISADNIYFPNFLSVLKDYLDAHASTGLVYADYQVVNAAREIQSVTSGKPYSMDRLHAINCVGICFLYRRSVMTMVGEYRPSLCEDYDYWLRASRVTHFAHVAAVLGAYREHARTRTRHSFTRLQKDRDRLLLEHAGQDAAMPCLPALTFREMNESWRILEHYTRRILRFWFGDRPAQLAVWGSGVLADFLIACIAETIHRVVAVTDNHRGRWHTSLHGVPVLPPEVFAHVACDAYLIASYAARDAIRGDLMKLGIPAHKVIPLFPAQDPADVAYMRRQRYLNLPNIEKALRDGLETWKWHDFMLDRMPRIRGRILDVGCGDGRFTTRLRSRGYVVGIDFIFEFLARAVRQYGLQGGLMDMHVLGFRDACFAMVYADNVLEHALHPEQVIRELYRVLDDEGYLVAFVPYDGLGDVRHGLPAHEWRIAGSVELKAVLRGAGFREIVIEEVDVQEKFSIAYPPADNVFGLIQARK